MILQGWQLLIKSAQECLDSLVKGQQQPQLQGRSLQAQPLQSPTPHSSWMTTATAVGAHTSVQLHATEILAELVANISRGKSEVTSLGIFCQILDFLTHN